MSSLPFDASDRHRGEDMVSAATALAMLGSGLVGLLCWAIMLYLWLF